MQYWDGSMRPLYTLPEPEAGRVRLEFQLVLFGDILLYKVGGFADHVGARIVQADETCIRLEVGRRSLLPSKRFAVELTLGFESEPTTQAQTVKLELRPLGWVPSEQQRKARYEQLVRLLHSYLMPHDVSEPPVSAA